MVKAGFPSGRVRRVLRFPSLCAVSACLLAACTTPTQAPVVDLSESRPGVESTARAEPVTYVVRAGDTLYSIARAHNVTWQDIALWNNITDPSQLRVGATLVVSPPDAAGTPAPAAIGSTAVAQAEPIVTGGVQQRPLDGAPDAQAASTGSTTTNSAPGTANVSGIEWSWPAQGRIIAQFNEALNKGIDIEGREGDPVYAAADGIVEYAGDSLPGYGNLLIIGHGNSYRSVYAHNRALLVKERDTVRRGQQIAELGQTDAPSPRLHFEIRRGGVPEDPVKYLPQR